jgi:hypothetical protein
MECLIIEGETGVSFQFDDLIQTGEVQLNYEISGITIKCPFNNTNYIRLSSDLFKNKGDVMVKVLSSNKLIRKKRITYSTQ